MATGWRLREERGERREWQCLGTGRGGERRDQLRTQTENEFCEQDNRHSEWYRDWNLKFFIVQLTRSPFIINQERNPLETSWGLEQIYIQVDNNIKTQDIDFHRVSKRKLSGKVQSSRQGARNVLFDVADFHIYFCLGKEKK